MGTERLLVELERRGDGSVHLLVTGALDGVTVPLLTGVLAGLAAERATVVLDLQGVHHIDARGLDLLLATSPDGDSHGHAVTITGVRESLGAPVRLSTRGRRDTR